MATIADVRAWWTERGFHHVVRSCKEGWLMTLCDTLVMGTEPDDKPPEKLRMCRVCRERLKQATVAEE